MSHSLSDVDLSPIDLRTKHPEDRQPLDDGTIVLTKPLEWATDTTPRLSREQLENVTYHPEGQDDPHITVNIDQPQKLLTLLCPPMTRLPPEILTYIFELYVDCVTELTPFLVPEQGPFCLARVCKLWRAIAESDPRLWTFIRFYFPKSCQSREDDVPRVESLFDLLLKRSGGLPVSLTFIDRRIYHSDTEDLVSLLVGQLRLHARRWKRILLHLSCGYFPLLFDFTPCDLSSLEHLDISGDVLEQCDTTLCLNLESAPNLKSFAYSGPGPSVDDGIRLRWENLTEVSFGFAPHKGTSSTSSRHFRRLMQCQGITTCSLGIDRSLWPAGPQTITFPCLQTLRVRRLSPDAHASTVIDCLIVPQLQTLDIDASILVDWDRPWHDRNFSDLLARSGCTLHHLSIQDVDFPNAELIRCLEFSHELTSFRFVPCPRSQNISDIIRILNVSHATRTQGPVANGPLIPRLREITLASSVEGILDLMMEMFRSRAGARVRAAGVAALRRVRVVFLDMSRDRNVNRVSTLRARLGRLASFRAELARWVAENKNENGHDGDDLEASVVVYSLSLDDYIDIP